MIATTEKPKSISHDFLKKLNIHPVSSGACTGTEWLEASGEIIESYSPADGEVIGKVKTASRNDYEKIISTSQKAFLEWRKIPAPKRGEVVRQIGDELRRNKEALGMLVSYEMGEKLPGRSWRSAGDD